MNGFGLGDMASKVTVNVESGTSDKPTVNDVFEDTGERGSPPAGPPARMARWKHLRADVRPCGQLKVPIVGRGVGMTGIGGCGR